MCSSCVRSWSARLTRYGLSDGVVMPVEYAERYPGARVTGAFDSYVSDPKKAVPYIACSLSSASVFQRSFPVSTSIA